MSDLNVNVCGSEVVTLAVLQGADFIEGDTVLTKVVFTATPMILYV